MPTIIQIEGLKVQIFADDRFPPHFHVVGAGFEVLVLISGLTILKGHRHRRHIGKAMDWARENANLLDMEWSRLND